MRPWLKKVIDWIGGHEAIVLVAMLIPLCGIWAFIALAGEVMDGDTQHFDERILLSLRRADDPSTPIGPSWLPEVGRDVTALGGVTLIVLITASVSGFLLLARKYAATAFVIAAITSGFLVSSSLKRVFDRPRPAVVPHLMDAHYSSFPSGHSMVSAVVYLTLGALVARLLESRASRLYVLAVAGLLTVLVGVSRVYLGVHYPTDVLAGWCAGIVWATLCWLVERQLQRRGEIEAEGPEPAPPARTTSG